MRQHHNTLYVTTSGTWLGKRDEAIEVKRDKAKTVRVPLHHLNGIVCLGIVNISPFLMRACAERNIAIAFCTQQGRFLARVVGPQNGNVLLRRDQYRLADQPQQALAMARAFVKAKLYNTRQLLLRAAREQDSASLRGAGEALKKVLRQVDGAADVERLRGLEGQAAKHYFDCFPVLLTKNDDFTWQGRHYRPPTDPANAVLSFCYSLLAGDCDGALQAAGLDPQVGFLHVDRPGRPALALDLMEEFRALLADRLLFTLANRGQLNEDHFENQEGGAVYLNPKGRKLVINAYQARKRVALEHPLLGEKTTFGLLPHLQARLLARAIRGDVVPYPSFLAVV